MEYFQLLLAVLIFLSISTIVFLIFLMGGIMAALDTLNSAISNLNITINAVKDYVAGLPAQSGVPEESVQAAADAVNAAQATLASVIPPAGPSV